MNDLPNSDHAAVARGAERLRRALLNSLLLPGEVRVLETILGGLSQADRALREPAEDVSDPVAHAGGLLFALLDTWRRARTWPVSTDLAGAALVVALLPLVCTRCTVPPRPRPRASTPSSRSRSRTR